jgi:hypothetical protein
LSGSWGYHRDEITLIPHDGAGCYGEDLLVGQEANAKLSYPHLLLSLRNPHRLRVNLCLWLAACICPPTALQTADGPHVHSAVHLNLAGKTHTAQTALGQFVLLGLCHRLRFPSHEFNPAGGAAAIAAAGMKLIDAGIFHKREDEPLALGYIKCTKSFNCQLRHEKLLC